MPRLSRKSFAPSPHKTPINVPLNDDRQEKAARRHAQQEAQRNSLRASATPARHHASQAPGEDSVHTPAHHVDFDMPDAVGTTATPAKPLVVSQHHFEDMIKLVADNKITADKLWIVDLIEYFAEMSLLRQGDGINFSMASTTLEGCVKVYTNRVDSVATDTGKLLSGLAENAGKKRRGAVEDGDDGEDDDDGKKRKKRAARSEVTLASSFAQLANKKMDLEFSVDPLFKKVAADFDEGGAKGLLLNHLSIDANGRIVFDSSDDVKDATPEENFVTAAPEETTAEEVDIEIDIAGLASKYFPDLARLDQLDICHSMKEFDLGDVDGSMDLPFLKAPEDWQNDGQQDADAGDDEAGNRSGIVLDDDNPMGFDDDDDMPIGPEAGFGEGGEAWARAALQDPQARVHLMGHSGAEGGAEDDMGEGAQYGLSMVHERDLQQQENILSYFDKALKKNWAGPEHWRIQRVKEAGKVAPVTKRKEKELFEIDFAAPMSQATADLLYTPATSKSTISLPKAQWKSKTRNLLPDDKHFNSKQLLRLFLKPKARMGSRVEGRRVQPLPEKEPAEDVDEAYWANRNEDAPGQDEGVNYDANFFQDDPLPHPGGPIDDDIDEDIDEDGGFADARDHFSPVPQDGIPPSSQPLDGALLPSSQASDAYGAELVTLNRRFRPEYVQYARVAKKVDVKRLKDNLWKGTGWEENTAPPSQDAPQNDLAVDASLTFTDVVNRLPNLYPSRTLADISTSYCFICVLHLANEKGLKIDNHEGYGDLTIKRDWDADLGVGAWEHV